MSKRNNCYRKAKKKTYTDDHKFKEYVEYMYKRMREEEDRSRQFIAGDVHHINYFYDAVRQAGAPVGYTINGQVDYSLRQ